MLNSRRVLVLAPHTDDAELGVGGTIARFSQAGADIFIAVFSTAEQSLPEGAPEGTLRNEFLASMKQLGLSSERLYVFNFEVRRFNYRRQEILEELVAMRRDMEPDVVFLPSSSDVHQDHRVIHYEGLRAFKNSTVLGYELPWNMFTFEPRFMVHLTKEHIELKWAMLENYRTQLELARPYFSKDFIEGLARVRGVQAGTNYAEAFETIRVHLGL